MEVDVIVPQMGESVAEATVAALLTPSGSAISEGQEIMELETDKVNQVLYASASGVVSFTVKVGDAVKIGQIVAKIEAGVSTKAEIVTPKLEMPSQDKVIEKPLQDKIERKKMTPLRKTIAARLVEVKNTTAMLTTFNEVDMTEVISFRKEKQESFIEHFGVKLGLMSFFVKATVEALLAYPIIHSYLEGDEIVTPLSYDIGIAVSTDRGLIVPVIKNCKELSFGQIEQQIAGYATKAREGKIAIDDLKGGSFTITNGGVFGSLLSTPILNPPQSAILGMHSIIKRPIALDDVVAIRPMMYLALSYDHRIIDGKEAVLFLIYIKQLLENPKRLFV
jgi:2-oxoglutarate dehydrogenase E2 component (dihydrolipoamide succinyltransferase)